MVPLTLLTSLSTILLCHAGIAVTASKPLHDHDIYSSLGASLEKMSSKLAYKLEVFNSSDAIKRGISDIIDNSTFSLPGFEEVQNLKRAAPQASVATWNIDSFGNKLIFQGSITIQGNKAFKVLPDTGSSLTVVNPHVYRPGPLAKDTGKRFRVSYNDASVASGKIYEDVIKISGLKVKTTICRADRPFNDPNFYYQQNGILGIGRTTTNHRTGVTRAFIEDFKTDGALKSNMMTIKLSRKESKITLGALDADIIDATVHYSPVGKAFEGDGRWETEAFINGIGGPAILDIGSTHSWWPKAKAEQIFKSYNLTIVDKGRYSIGQYKCNNGPPLINVKLGGGFNFNMSDISTRLQKSSNEECYIFLIGADIDPVKEMIIIGSDMFRNIYGILDWDNDRIGFAQRKLGSGE